MPSLAKARKTWEPIFLITDQPISCTIFLVHISIFSFNWISKGNRIILLHSGSLHCLDCIFGRK